MPEWLTCTISEMPSQAMWQLHCTMHTAWLLHYTLFRDIQCYLMLHSVWWETLSVINEFVQFVPSCQFQDSQALSNKKKRFLSYAECYIRLWWGTLLSPEGRCYEIKWMVLFPFKPQTIKLHKHRLSHNVHYWNFEPTSRIPSVESLFY